MRAVGLLALCLLSSAKCDKSKDLRYAGKGNQASPDVFFDPSTGKFVNHKPLELERISHRNQKNLNHKEPALSNSLAESTTTLDSKTNPKDVYDSLAGFKNSPGPQGSPPLEYNHFNSPEEVVLDSKAGKYHFTIGGNGQKSGAKVKGESDGKIKGKNNFYEEISFQEDHESEKLVTPSGVVADKPSNKRYQYDYTIGDDPNLAFKNLHPTEPISKNQVETTTPYTTTTTTSTTPITTKRPTTFQSKRLVNLPSRRQIITRRPVDTERSTTTATSTSALPKRSQLRPNMASSSRQTTTLSTTTTTAKTTTKTTTATATTTTTTITSTRRTTTSTKTTTFSYLDEPFFSTEKPTFEISESINFDEFNDESNYNDFQSKPLGKSNKKIAFNENFDSFSSDRNEVISDVYPENESAKFPHFPVKKNVAANYDDFYSLDDYEDDLQLEKFPKQDNEILPSTDSFVKSSTAPPLDFESFKPINRIKLPSRHNLETTTTKSPQQTVNLPSKIYFPDPTKSTTFKPDYQDYKNYDYDQTYEVDVEKGQEASKQSFIKDQLLNLPSKSSFSQTDSLTTPNRFPSFQANSPGDVKKPINPPVKKNYNHQDQDHWHSQSIGNTPKIEPNRPDYDYPDEYYSAYKHSGQLDVPRREFVDNYEDEGVFREKDKRKVPDWTNYERPGYGSAKDTSYQSVTFPKTATPQQLYLENIYQQEKLPAPKLLTTTTKAGKKLKGEKAAPFVYFGPNYPNHNQPAPVQIPLQDDTKNLYEDSVLFQPAYKQPPISESSLEQFPVLQDNPLLPPPMPGYSAPDLYGKDIPRSKWKQPLMQPKQPDYPSSFSNYQTNEELSFDFATPSTKATSARPSTSLTTRKGIPLSNEHLTYPLKSPPPPPPAPYVSVRPYGEPAQLQVIREERPERSPYQQQNKNLPPPPPPPTKPPPPPPPPSYPKEYLSSATERTRFNSPFDRKNNIPSKAIYGGAPYLQLDRQQLLPALSKTGHHSISMFRKRDGGFSSGEKRGSLMKSGAHVTRKQPNLWPFQFRGKRQEDEDDEEVIES